MSWARDGCLLVFVGFAALVIGCTGACAAYTKLTILEAGDFTSDVEHNLPAGASEDEALGFLERYARRHQDDVADFRWADTIEPASKYECGPLPCSPVDLGAPEDLLVIRGVVDTGQVYPWSWFCVEGYYFWLVFEPDGGFRDVVTENADTCL